MRKISVFSAVLLVSAAASATPTVASADSFDAVAYLTLKPKNGEPINRIDTAYLNRDTVVLYVDWNKLGMRSNREVRIFDPNGRFVGHIRSAIGRIDGRYSTYYYYRPGLRDIPGDWTYKMYVDGRDAFEARIPVLAVE
jgi:hypothetical protein